MSKTKFPDREAEIHKGYRNPFLLLYVLLMFVMSSCSSSESPPAEKPAAEVPSIQMTVPIAGVWLAPFIDQGIFYVISLDPKTSTGNLAAEYLGKTIREYKFTVTGPNEIQLNGAKREKAHLVEGEYIDMTKVYDALRLSDAPSKLRFEVNSESQKEKSLKVYGLIQFGNGAEETPIAITWITEEDRTIIPFKDVVADLKLSYGPVTGSVSPDMDPSKGTFDSLIHPSGQVNNLKIGGKSVPLIDSNFKDGLLRTKDFGDFELVMAGSSEGQRTFLVTRSQIIKIAKWLDETSALMK